MYGRQHPSVNNIAGSTVGKVPPYARCPTWPATVTASNLSGTAQVPQRGVDPC
jgi:hypothetical protein